MVGATKYTNYATKCSPTANQGRQSHEGFVGRLDPNPSEPLQINLFGEQYIGHGT